MQAMQKTGTRRLLIVSGSIVADEGDSPATAVAVHGTLADGSSYENIFNQFMHMSGAALPRSARWRTPEILQRAMDRLAAAGYEEAHAVPITDDPATWPSHR